MAPALRSLDIFGELRQCLVEAGAGATSSIVA
jgi:hypothetical protein